MYKAVDDATGGKVVIKAYHKKKMQPKHYHKLQREINAMSLMGGMYVVQLYCHFQDEDNVYLIMEFCEGGDLFKYMMLKGGSLDEHAVCVQVGPWLCVSWHASCAGGWCRVYVYQAIAP